MFLHDSSSNPRDRGSMQECTMLSTKLTRAASRLRPSLRRTSVVVSASDVPKQMKLYYFELPGRGETTRLMAKLGKLPLEDYRFSREQWAELKPKMPFGQCPVLEVDGKMLAQQNAIERYVAKLSGLYPADAWEAAKVDEIVSFMAEFQEAFLSSFFIKDQAEKLAARKNVVDGPLKAKLTKLNSLLEESKSGFLVGSKVTYADVAAFSMLSWVVSGFFDGVPKDTYKPFPAVCAYHDRMASIPEIKTFYEDVKEGIRLAYQPGYTKA